MSVLARLCGAGCCWCLPNRHLAKPSGLLACRVRVVLTFLPAGDFLFPTALFSVRGEAVQSKQAAACSRLTLSGMATPKARSDPPSRLREAHRVAVALTARGSAGLSLRHRTGRVFAWGVGAAGFRLPLGCLGWRCSASRTRVFLYKVIKGYRLAFCGISLCF